MPQLLVVDRAGHEHRIDITAWEGVSIMEAIRGVGLQELAALCGGNCSCGTCQVYVDPACGIALPPMQAGESELLDFTGIRRESSRLTCQIPIAAELDGLRLTIAPEF